MFSTDDVIIDPAQAWYYKQSEKNPQRKNNCPIWARLSGWAGGEDAYCLIMGANEESRYIEPKKISGTMNIKEYAEFRNKNLYTLVAIVHNYGKGSRIRKTRFYDIVAIDALCLQYWPPENMISHSDAMAIVKKPHYLPKPAWKLDNVRYYDREECAAMRVKMMQGREAGRVYSKKMKHERSQAEKERRRQIDKIRKQKERLLAAKLPKQKRVYHPRLEGLQLPAGYIKMVDACRDYNLKRNTVNKAVHEGRVIGHKVNDVFIVSIDSIKKFIEVRDLRNTPKVRVYKKKAYKPVKPLVVPEGYIGKREYMEIWPRSYAALYKAIQKGRLEIKELRSKYFIKKDSLIAYIEKTSNRQPELI